MKEGYYGRTIQKSSDVFRSQAQLVEAMGDPRYDRDQHIDRMSLN